MNTTTRRTAALVAAGVLGLGGLAVAAPALAGQGLFGSAATAGQAPSRPGGAGMGPGMGPGMGTGMGPGMGTGMGSGMGTGMGSGMGTGMGTGMGSGMGSGMGPGMGVGNGGCAGLTVTAAKGTLTGPQRTALLGAAVRQQLGRDLYAAFADRYPAMIFDHLAAAGTHRLTAIRTLLVRYGLADPTAGRPAGQFSDPAVQATYARLLAQGRTGQAAAQQAAQTVERTDIAALQAGLTGLAAPDVQQVNTALLTMSRHHLAMLEHWSGR